MPVTSTRVSMFRSCILALLFLQSVTSSTETQPVFDGSGVDDGFELDGVWIPMIRQSEEGSGGFPVFHASASSGSYKLDYGMAETYCRSHNTVVAALRDLREAWNMGMEMCSCGWVSDRTARYPMQSAKSGCGDSMAIIRCEWRSTWDVYCKSKGAHFN